MMKSKKQSKNSITIDVMRFFYEQERFFCTLEYPHLACFKLDIQDLYDFVIKQKPPLEGQRIKIYLGEESITIYPYQPKLSVKSCHRKLSTNTTRI